MGKKAYLSVGGTARNIKTGYLGIDGVARAVRKCYVGIGGVARPCWPAPVPVYYGSVDGTYAGINNAAARAGDYAVFHGGESISSTSMNYVTALHKSLVVTETKGGGSRKWHAGATAGDCAVFVGYVAGTTGNAIDGNLTSITLDYAFERSDYHIAATSIGDGAIFTGAKSGVVAVSADLVCTALAELSVSRSAAKGTAVGDYAIFAGGTADSAAVATADAYDKNLVKVEVENLTTARNYHAAATARNYALFAGGTTEDSTRLATVEAYTKNLVKAEAPDLMSARSRFAGVTIGDCALFAGGNTSTVVVDADCYNDELVKVDCDPLANKRRYHAGTSVGKLAVFGGGEASSSSRASSLEYYILS